MRKQNDSVNWHVVNVDGKPVYLTDRQGKPQENNFQNYFDAAKYAKPGITFAVRA